MSDIDKNSILSLLDDAKPIIDKIQKEEYAKKVLGENFNLFSVFGIERREIYVCKMIGDLLSPQGRHGVGSVFIKKFFEQEKFAAFNITDSELETATVVCEKSTSEGRRIDFVIQTASWIIPIEAKIDAEDQPNQCADYFFEIEDRAKIYGIKSSKIYYLTLDGRRPSPNSMGKLTDSQVDTLTWKENILAWLEDCCNLAEVQRRNIVFTNIRQLVETIKGWYKMDDSFEKIIRENNFSYAVQLWHIIDKARNELWDNLIIEFEREMSARGIELKEIPTKKHEYLYKRNVVISNEPINIGVTLQNRGKDVQGIVFYLIVDDGRFEDKRYYIDKNYKHETFQNYLSDEVRNLLSNQQKSFELPWLYREEFPDYQGEKINFSSFCGETEKLLLKKNLEYYVREILIPRFLKLTGWESKTVTSCDKETPDD